MAAWDRALLGLEVGQCYIPPLMWWRGVFCLGAFLFCGAGLGGAGEAGCGHRLLVSEEQNRVWVLGLKQRNLEVFETCERVFSPVLHRFLLSRGLSQEDAEDCAQAVFLGLWRQSETLNPDKSLLSYLLGMAFNKQADLRKSSAFRRLHPISQLDCTREGRCDSEITDPRDPSGRPGDSIVIDDEVELQAARFVSALELLGDQQRRYILSRLTGGGVSNLELAEQLGVSASALEPGLTRARRILEARLSRRPLEPEVSVEDFLKAVFRLLPQVLEP